MTQANLSETLFKPRFKHPETSTLVRRFNHGAQPPVQSALDGKTIPHWYRMINRLMWIWRGIDPREILDVQKRELCIWRTKSWQQAAQHPVKQRF